jgi:hypothetical protein
MKLLVVPSILLLAGGAFGTSSIRGSGLGGDEEVQQLLEVNVSVRVIE